MRRIVIDLDEDLADRLIGQAIDARRPLKLQIVWLLERAVQSSDGSDQQPQPAETAVCDAR